MLTCYDYSMARIMDECGIDSLLVGDSLGMVMLGYPDTVPVSMDEMVHHCAAVARGAANALIICDMPFLSSQCGVESAIRNAGRLLKEGRAQAVKMECDASFAPEVEALTRASIPVIAHIGLTPQSVHAIGGYKVQGKEPEAAERLLNDAIELEKAGAFALLLECVPAELAQRITSAASIPTIGIGAGPFCDGQVLVCQDMLGITSRPAPRFARRFADCGNILRTAFADYIAAVRDGSFPSDKESYHQAASQQEASE